MEISCKKGKRYIFWSNMICGRKNIRNINGTLFSKGNRERIYYE